MQELIKALAKAQGEFPEISKSKTVTVKTKSGGTYQYSYAPLSEINQAVIPALSKNGLAIVHTIENSEKGSLIRTTLWHSSGESLSSELSLPTSGEIQALGGNITFRKRYLLCALLNIAAEEDNDANEVMGHDFKQTNKPKAVNSNLISEPQKKRLFAIANEHNWETAAVKGMLSQMGFDSSAKVTKAKYEEVCKNLENAELCAQWNEHIALREIAEEQSETLMMAAN